MSSLSTELQTSTAPHASKADVSVDEPREEVQPLKPDTPPGWFQKRRQQSATVGEAAPQETSERAPLLRRATLPKLDVLPDNEADNRNWNQRTIDWLRGAAAESYGASLIVHAILLFCMSLYIFRLQDENSAVSLVASESNNLPLEFEEIVALQLDTAGNADKTELPQNQTLPLQIDPLLASDVAVDLAQYAGSGDGQDGDDSSGMLFAMPSGGQVVSAGSFSAWTVPKDPGPGEDYKIVIMVKVPSKRTVYPISDLSGVVIGTDGFRLEIPFGRFRERYGTRITRLNQLVFPRRSDRVRVVDGSVQIVVDIPGATRLVKDTIEVKSRMLDEDQTLEIEF
jgi:hypothetical protein